MDEKPLLRINRSFLYDRFLPTPIYGIPASAYERYCNAVWNVSIRKSMFSMPGRLLYAPLPRTISTLSLYPSCIFWIQHSLAGTQSASVNSNTSCFASRIPMDNGYFLPLICFASCVSSTPFRERNVFLSSFRIYLESSTELSFTTTTSLVLGYDCTNTPGRLRARFSSSSRAPMTTETACCCDWCFTGVLKKAIRLKNPV